MKVLFWNIQDAYNKQLNPNETNNHFGPYHFSRASGDYFDTRIIDFSLINNPKSTSASIKVFKNNNLTNCSLSFKQFIYRNRVLVFDLKINNKAPILLICVHLKSKALLDAKTQLINNLLATTEIHELHKKNNKRSIVVGDFNHNPFETLISSVYGMNCISNNHLLKHIRSRPLYYHPKDTFLNPMWKLYHSDNDFPGTYFYKKEYHKKADDFHWNMYDQILISSIMDSLDVSSLAIVTSYHNTLNAKDYFFAHEMCLSTHDTYMNPVFSDHLPITFTIDSIN